MGKGPTERSPDDEHYLKCIKLRLLQLYELSAAAPSLREKISDELDWVNEKLGIEET